jgi:hypothetical protein
MKLIPLYPPFTKGGRGIKKGDLSLFVIARHDRAIQRKEVDSPVRSSPMRISARSRTDRRMTTGFIGGLYKNYATCKEKE